MVHDPAVASAYEHQFINIKMCSCVSLGSYLAAHPLKKRQIR